MDNHAQTLGIIILTSLFIMIIGFAIINLLTPEITNFRAEMQCASPSDITDGVKITCLVSDIVIIYWIWLILSVVIGSITARFVL